MHKIEETPKLENHKWTMCSSQFITRETGISLEHLNGGTQQKIN